MLPLFLLLAASPLDVVPVQADFFLHVQQPRALVENVLGHKLWAKASALAPVKEQLDATPVRRTLQLLAYFERGLGAKWPRLLDDLAGGGIVLAGKQGSNQPALLVVEGKDGKRQDRFAALLVELVNDELSRQGGNAKVAESSYRKAKLWSVGDGAFLAQVGPYLMASNKRAAIKAAIDLHAGEGTSLASLAEVKGMEKLLPKGSLGRAWFSLRAFQASKAGKELYKEPRDNFLATLFIGGYLSVFGRTPYVAAALVPQEKGFRLTVRAPVGRKEMGADKALHAPAAKLPALLEPEGALYSLSWAYDFASLWNDRHALFNPAQAKGLEDLDKNPVIALLGAKAGPLLRSTGRVHRFVALRQGKTGYKKRPATRIPSFALVTTPREPQRFGRTMNSLLRAVGLFNATEFKLRLKEEKHGGTTIVGYRFSEKEALPGDPTDYRFNFSPCWVQTGEQFVFSSTFEAAKAVLDALAAEKPGTLPGRAADKVYPAGLAALLEYDEDALVARTVLGQAVAPVEARAQVKAFLALVESLGGAGTSSAFGDEAFRFDVWFKAE